MFEENINLFILKSTKYYNMSKNKLKNTKNLNYFF